ncbi:hypothetical protein [Clostridium sp.]|uniref:hypothetical protein n=1 Tax=Clostridium sp. TaxID=1506 RepID=UPI001A3FB2EE|nr:hypothetical protein [Clostridium sp.]MBK5240248.1 hypothetical protein [Clostridium sp.]
MKTVACMLKLGQTRTAGYTLYDENTHEFEETTPKVVKDLIIRGQVNGLKLNDGEIQLDEEGFNICNLMVKSSVGRYRPLYPTTSMISRTYAVTRVIKTDKEKLYILISNKCARFKFKNEQLKGLIDIGGYVAGVRLVEGKIEVCKGVSILDQTKKDIEVKELLDATSVIIDSASPKIDEVNLQKEQGVTDIGNGSEKTDSLENVFDTLETIKVTAEIVTKPDGKYLNYLNTPGDKDDMLIEEPVVEKKLVAHRKTKRK